MGLNRVPTSWNFLVALGRLDSCWVALQCELSVCCSDICFGALLRELKDCAVIDESHCFKSFGICVVSMGCYWKECWMIRSVECESGWK